MLEILKQKLILNAMKKKITQMWRRWGTPQNFLWHLLMNSAKPEKSEFWKKWKKKTIAGDIIILHMCTKNHNHMRYGYWDMEGERIFCHLGPFFAFLPHNNPENQNFKEGKKHLKMSSFHACAPKTWSYDVCLLRYGVRQTWLFVIVGHFLLFYPTIEPKN